MSLTPQQKQAMNIPSGFSGSVDPTMIFPSVEIYPSSSYISKESGRYYGMAASPTSYDLDPYFYFNANDFSIVAKDIPSTGAGKNYNIKKDPVQNQVRTMGFKGPILLSGWGYDVCGLPVPNLKGSVVSGEYSFKEKTAQQRQNWKTGPIDLRWHNKRKTWVGGHEMLEGYLLEDLNAPTSKNSSTSAKMLVFRSVGSNGLSNNRKETITVVNRDPSLSLKDGDYAIAVDINYEWRILKSGTGGGNVEFKGKDTVLVILGPWSDYQDCSGAPPKPPVATDANCPPAYAWSAYKVCGYKYKKVATFLNGSIPSDDPDDPDAPDIPGLGFWATELNGGGTSSWRRFHPAWWGWDTESDSLIGNDIACGGVRFTSPGVTALQCQCPYWLTDVACIKLRVKYREDPGSASPGCDICYEKMSGFWGTEQTAILCNEFQGFGCLWTSNNGPFPFTSAFGIYSDMTVIDPCFTGPDWIDPCYPCDGWGSMSFSIQDASQPVGCGGPSNSYVVAKVKENLLRPFIEACKAGINPGPLRLTNLEDNTPCANYVEWMEIECCSCEESNNECGTELSC